MTMRYKAIAADLASKIERGAWKVGAFLPAEPALAAEYGCSRETVRSALAQLEDQGLIARRKGQGTRVLRTTPANEFHSRLTSIEELAQYGQEARRRVESVERLPARGAAAGWFGVNEETRLVRIATTRRLPGQHSGEYGAPVSAADVYLLESDFDAVSGELGSGEQLIADIVAARTGRRLVRVLQSIQAIEIPPHTAALLGREPGSLGLRLTRRYVDGDGAVFEVVESVHPGESFVYESVLERAG
ncbi:GntR family transcriptional regulator [Sinomonas sp. P10A9]|uniref:GntR family transcriptional regulator n=1 Tax=Sinomonas puerhi TaxID=3238584 RepID=A0AB39L1J5_9MICC